MTRRVSSLDKTTVGIERDISSQYDNVKIVADNIEDVSAVAASLSAVTTVHDNLEDITLAAAAAEQTALDVITTNADAVQTGLDVDATSADVLLTNADAAATAADRVQTGLDVTTTSNNAAITNADVVLTNADAVQTALNRVQTGLDAAATSADVATMSTVVATTTANVVQTGLDRTATGADVITTNANALLTSTDAATTSTNAGLTAADVITTGLAATSASDDAAQTVLDVITTATNAAQTASDVVLTHADVVTISDISTRILTLFDNFDDRYLGTFSVGPTLDNDGDPIGVGAIYYDDGLGLNELGVKFWDGSAWDEPEVSTLAAANAAALDAILAGKWAAEDEDVEVTPGEYSAKHWALKAELSSTGENTMTKTVYDTNANGVVDNAERVNNLTVETSVPANAVFTDTVYDDTALVNAIALNTTKETNVVHPLVETAVPIGAVFTDTLYDDTDVVKAPSGILPTLDGSNLTGVSSVADVTYDNLLANNDVGTSATQVAQGDHLHTGVYEPADTSIQTHINSAHAPTNADNTAANETSHTNVVVDAAYVHTDNNYTVADKNIVAATSGTNTGDQTKADIDLLNIDAATVNGLTVETAIPAGAVFTDTVYDDSTLAAAVALNTAKVSNVDHPLVEKAVPANAVFTDTTYSNVSSFTNDAGYLTSETSHADVLVDSDIGVSVQGYDADTVKAPSGVLPVLDGSNLTGIAASLSDLGVSATSTELNYVDGVTSAIQIQINSKISSTSYATSTVGGTVKVRLNGTDAYITTDGTTA